MEDDSDSLYHSCEYAKSDRSACKLCRNTIGKGSLRLAIMVQSPHFDGRVKNLKINYYFIN